MALSTTDGCDGVGVHVFEMDDVGRRCGRPVAGWQYQAFGTLYERVTRNSAASQAARKKPPTRNRVGTRAICRIGASVGSFDCSAMSADRRTSTDVSGVAGLTRGILTERASIRA